MVSTYLIMEFISLAKLTIKFLVGSILGLAIAVLIYDDFSFSSPVLNIIQIGASVVLIFFCGIQSASGGCKLVGELLKAFFDIAAIVR